MNTTLIVIYTTRLEECREFYQKLGLPLLPEKHGSGPEHYAAVLDGGHVFELYPARSGEPTGRLRLGFSLKPTAAYPVGRHIVQDPDGRAIELHVEEVEAN
ncbi:VOC family protein [Spirillospora sp. CA-253888]